MKCPVCEAPLKTMKLAIDQNPTCDFTLKTETVCRCGATVRIEHANASRSMCDALRDEIRSGELKLEPLSQGLVSRSSYVVAELKRLAAQGWDMKDRERIRNLIDELSERSGYAILKDLRRFLDGWKEYDGMPAAEYQRRHEIKWILDRLDRPEKPDTLGECIKAFQFDDISLQDTKATRGAVESLLRRYRELGCPELKGDTGS